MSIIYHLCRADYWDNQNPESDYFPSTFAQEGFIHCSTLLQLETSANKYYTHDTELVCLHIRPEELTSPLKYEFAASRGEDFPHIYGGIQRKAIRKIVRHIKSSNTPWKNLV